MALHETRILSRIGEGIAVVAALAVAGYFLIGVLFGQFWLLLVALVVVPLLVGPIAIAGLLVGTAARRSGAFAFLTLQTVLVLSFVGFVVYTRVFEPEAGIFFPLLPVFQFSVIGLALIVAPVFGWRFWREPRPGEA